MAADLLNERDARGNLTAMALACNALVDHGCDCGTDEPGTCLGCLCDAALKVERARALAAEADVARLTGERDTLRGVLHAYNSGELEGHSPRCARQLLPDGARRRVCAKDCAVAERAALLARVGPVVEAAERWRSAYAKWECGAGIARLLVFDRDAAGGRLRDAIAAYNAGGKEGT